MYRAYAPAKINLILRVLGKRENGYHEIFSLIQRVSLFDTLYFKTISIPKIEIKTNFPYLPTDKSNLIYQASELFFEQFHNSFGVNPVRKLGRGIKPRPRKRGISTTGHFSNGVNISLIKRIPVASGLGGGSSDAATTLLSLNKLFGRPFSKKRLSEMAISLGSDVPFFILKSTAIVTGKGEKVRPVDINLAFWYLILSPPIRVSTSEVYNSWKLTKVGSKPRKFYASKELIGRRLRNLRGKTEIPKAREILRSLENDLEDFAIRSFPDIALAKQMLKEVGAKKAIMTGSGGAVFGVFLTKKDACFARENLNLPKGWKVFLVTGL